MPVAARSGRCNSIRLILALLLALAYPVAAPAAQTLMTVEDGVVVYSGPGRRYRPIAKLDAKVDLKAADEAVEGKDGDYWRVIAPIDGDRKALGFVRTDWGVRKKIRGVADDDLANYPEISLARTTISTSISLLSGDRTAASVGLTRYLSPGFFLKLSAGGFSDRQSSGSTGAFEIGNDALLFGRVSGWVSLGTGLLLLTRPGRVFAGSAATNGLAQGQLGLRWNAPTWSAGLGWTQMAVFNANNSLVLFGPMAVIEGAL